MGVLVEVGVVAGVGVGVTLGVGAVAGVGVGVLVGVAAGVGAAVAVGVGVLVGAGGGVSVGVGVGDGVASGGTVGVAEGGGSEGASARADEGTVIRMTPTAESGDAFMTSATATSAAEIAPERLPNLARRLNSADTSCYARVDTAVSDQEKRTERRAW